MADDLGRVENNRHRASYLLELGTWRATCKGCGWTATDRQRRQVAAIFRNHIRDARLIDLNELAAMPPTRDSSQPSAAALSEPLTLGSRIEASGLEV